jgi:hypothetical protein
MSFSSTCEPHIGGLEMFGAIGPAAAGPAGAAKDQMRAIGLAVTTCTCEVSHDESGHWHDLETENLGRDGSTSVPVSMARLGSPVVAN